jgi:hypothetical protein
MYSQHGRCHHNTISYDMESIEKQVPISLPSGTGGGRVEGSLVLSGGGFSAWVWGKNGHSGYGQSVNVISVNVVKNGLGRSRVRAREGLGEAWICG